MPNSHHKQIHRKSLKRFSILTNYKTVKQKRQLRQNSLNKKAVVSFYTDEVNELCQYIYYPDEVNELCQYIYYLDEVNELCQYIYYLILSMQKLAYIYVCVYMWMPI